MNAKRLEQLLLLEQSGELSPDQRRQLDAELNASPEAQEHRAELRQLTEAIPPLKVEPAPDAAARIAGRLHKTPAPAFSPAWKPLLAAAAAVALMFGLRAYRSAAPGSYEPALAAATTVEVEWTDPFEAEFAELESLIATISPEESFEISEI